MNLVTLYLAHLANRNKTGKLGCAQGGASATRISVRGLRKLRPFVGLNTDDELVASRTVNPADTIMLVECSKRRLFPLPAIGQSERSLPPVLVF